MFGLLFAVSAVGTIVQLIKESNTKPIPAENWANKELYYEDIMNGVPVQQRMKNLKNGKYKLDKSYPEPHRDPVSGKIMIENYELYCEDVRNYGACQAQKWVGQGKYNLSEEELKKEKERIKAKLDKLYG